ncbi:hypothetical protein AURDEDRAFT_167558 [Auricularia subglabra TFB-10046 SS5]|nr:hypothetical protein AURDEDRAFT_167558 [Auricularia subglabra TFB-10046 SS5]
MFPEMMRRPDHATWDEDDGGMSGSSRGNSDDERPYVLNAQQRLEQRIRHVERRARYALPRAEQAEAAMARVEERLREVEANLPGAQAVTDVLRRGIRARNERLPRPEMWEGWS